MTRASSLSKPEPLHATHALQALVGVAMAWQTLKTLNQGMRACVVSTWRSAPRVQTDRQTGRTGRVKRRSACLSLCGTEPVLCEPIRFI
jgi:hypothetical protein